MCAKFGITSANRYNVLKANLKSGWCKLQYNHKKNHFQFHYHHNNVLKAMLNPDKKKYSKNK